MRRWRRWRGSGRTAGWMWRASWSPGHATNHRRPDRHRRRKFHQLAELIEICPCCRARTARMRGAISAPDRALAAARSALGHQLADVLDRRRAGAEELVVVGALGEAGVVLVLVAQLEELGE